MQTRRLLILTAVVAASGAPAAPASAQSGVIVDSDSPTGQEYALPLESAKREANGDKAAAPGDTSTSPLFGAGVGDAESGDGKGGKQGGGSGSKPESRASKRGEQPRSGGTSVSTGRTAAATVPEGGLGSAVTIAAVALSVLLLGGVIGSIVRRRGA